MYDNEDDYQLSDNGKYSIGLCFRCNNDLVLECELGLEDFHRNSYRQNMYHLLQNSCVYPNWRRLEIMKFDFCLASPSHNPDWIYHRVILKTFFIRLVQRRWKKVYAQRQQILQSKKMLSFLSQRERTGKANIYFPSLRGMMVN